MVVTKSFDADEKCSLRIGQKDNAFESAGPVKTMTSNMSTSFFDEFTTTCRASVSLTKPVVTFFFHQADATMK